MIWNDITTSKPQPMHEVLVWIDGKRGSGWRNNHALVAYMTLEGKWFEERHSASGPLAGVIKWAEIHIPSHAEMQDDDQVAPKNAKQVKQSSKTLKLWNGRGGDVTRNVGNGRVHLNIAAYSAADARRLCVELGLRDPGASEIKNYWSPRWGNSMDGIAPERGIWIEFGYGKEVPKRIEPNSTFLGDS